MFSKLTGVQLLMLFCAAQAVYAQPDSLKKEWKLLAAQNELVQSNDPYIVIDKRSESFVLKLGNAVVSTLHEDSGTAKLNIASLADDFSPDSVFLFSTAGIRLIKFEPRFPDSLLKIVSEAMDMDPSLLQREIPVAFEVTWRNGPTLLVHSTPENDPVEVKVPFREKLGLWLQSFKGHDKFSIQTNREVALTLYRTLKNGALTLVLR